MRISYIIFFFLLVASSLGGPTSWEHSESAELSGQTFESESFLVPLLGGEIEAVLDLNETVDVKICLKAVDPIPDSDTDWKTACTYYYETTIVPPSTPTEAPTHQPNTTAPTEAPTAPEAPKAPEAPTHEPNTTAPTEAPTVPEAPTEAPTEGPTEAPTTETPTAPVNPTTAGPTEAPTESPTEGPTEAPTERPTEAPTSEAPTSPVNPTTAGPTEAPTTEVPTEAPTEVPTTQSPTTQPPTTASPTTQVPTEAPTDVPTTQPPTTQPPTSAPPTDAPTDAPTTQPPTTQPPTTQPPTTQPPTTQPPTTQPPTTQPPTTQPPTTQPPTTQPPTQAPTTAPPTTQQPTAPVPTAPAPVPTTAAPTTQQPTAPVPTNPAPVPAPAPVGFLKRSLVKPETVHFNFTLPITRTNYRIGIAYKVASEKTLTHVDLKLSSPYACTSDDEIPPSCQVGLPMNTTTNHTLDPDTEKYFYVDVAPFASEYTFSTADVASIQATSNLPIWVGYEVVPTPSNHYAYGVGFVTIQNPPAGRYYALVRNNYTTIANFSNSYHDQVCNPNTGKVGYPNCSVSVSELVHPNVSIVTLGKNSTTYMVKATGAAIRISSGQLPAADPGARPGVYVRRNNLPATDAQGMPYNDYNGCNPEVNSYNCSNVVQVFIPQTTAGDIYFVTIDYFTDNKVSSYATWVQDVCAFNCSGHGTCQSYNAMCKCPEDFSATFYCSPAGSSSKLPIEYVVLIVIGCLVVLSAIIGFIAWAYMRRKRIHYEKV